MSLDKAIIHGKEKRRPYQGSARFDSSCRCHGGCPWCEGNRKHADNRRDLGFLAGEIKVPADFDGMFEDEIAELFEGEVDDPHHSEVE